MKVNLHIPEIEIKIGGIRIERDANGLRHTWIYLLHISCECDWFDLYRSLFEYSLSEMTAVENPDDPEYANHELDLFFLPVSLANQ